MSAALKPQPNLWPDAELVLPASAPREEWLAARKFGVGGSETAALKHEHRYESEYRVWKSKTGRGDDKEQTKRMRMGQLLESGIAQFYAETRGVEIVPGPGLLRSLNYPHAQGTPDFFIPSQDRIVEVKDVDSYGVKKELLKGEFPAYWWWQIVHYLLVTGASSAVLVAKLPLMDDLWTRVIDRSEALADIETLGVFIEDWWTLHVELDVAPEYGADDSPDVPLELGDSVEAWVPDSAIGDLRRLREISVQIDGLEAEGDEIRQYYLQEIGAHKYLTANGRRIFQRIVRPNGRFNRKGLKKDYPEIEAKYSAPGQPTQYIRIYETEEAS